MSSDNDSRKATANGDGFKPYVADQVKMPEFTIGAVVLGTSLGLIFAASSLYLVLKIGMTVSASIPVAVLAITLFRALSKAFGLRSTTILENNIVQTSGSAGESIAFGVGVAMPTLLLIGFSMDLTRIMVVSLLGGVLGILAMIPLRRAFIVKMHGRPGQPGTLLYPEGTACAQVLISGEKGGTTGKTVFIGFGIAFAHKFVTEGMALLKETVKVPFSFINKAAEFSQAMASELLGVGYIIGMRTSAVMMAGAVLGYLIIIPIIYFVGEFTDQVVPPGKELIRDMKIKDIRNNYLLFIGAGTVATAGIISMLKTLPIIVRSVLGGLKTVGGGPGVGERKRTENDMPMSVVLLGSLGLVVLLAVFLVADVGIVAAVAGALLVVLFGFLFVTVSARLTGEIGSSSNPISGMTTATLMLTCLIFLALGWQGSTERLLALSVAAVVCIASSNGGTTAQALKTGYLVGGTPKLMQYAILIGALVSALVIGGTLIAFNESRAVVSMKAKNVPPFQLTPAETARLTDTVIRAQRTFKVWKTEQNLLTVADAKSGFQPRAEVVAVTRLKPGTYLVDPATGNLAITEEAIRTDVFPTYMLDKTEIDRLTETVTHDGKTYKVWHTRNDGLTDAHPSVGFQPRPATIQVATSMPGIYFVDPETNMIAAIKDNSIMGQLEERDNGSYVKREFEAPKTQVMGIVINGVLKGELNWSMIGIGAMIALMLELCGVSALAFAVGVYVPIQYSTPIFLGGIVRYIVDRYLAQQATEEAQQRLVTAVEAAGDDPAARMRAEAEAKAQAEIDAIRKSETSGGVLLASGFIAGGSLAGVLLGFLAFHDDWPDDIRKWEHRKTQVTVSQPLDKAADGLARNELGFTDADLDPQKNSKLDPKTAKKNTERLKEKTKEIAKDNGGEPYKWVKVPAGTTLKMPEGLEDYVVKADTTLKDVAAEVFGRERKAQKIFDKNAEKLKVPEALPVGAELKLPDSDWPAWIVFLGLAGFLAIVGVGRLFPPPPENGQTTTNHDA